MALPQKITVKNLLNLDYAEINALTKEQTAQLRKAVKVLADAGNKRLKRFEDAGEESPAYQYIKGGKRAKGKFSTKGKDLEQLKGEFKRAADFMKSATGSLRGWKEVKQNTIDKLRAESGIDLSPDEFDVFWRTYTELTKSDAGKKAAKQYKYQILEQIDQLMKPGTTVDEIVSKMTKTMDKLYEQIKEEEEREKDKNGGYTDIPGI